MMAETLKKHGKDIVDNIPRGRIGKAEDIIGVCVYLGSQAGAYITGSIIPVEGGLLLKAGM
jgi:NAD(P)-dependent dehydrogenase (short-subunit alcohol dehydrogenase family)